MSKPVFLFVVICGFAIVSVSGQELRAQEKSQADKQDDSQQRGRFFRRLREDIRSMTGTDEDEKEKLQQRELTASRAPTPATRVTGAGVQPYPGHLDGIQVPEPDQVNPIDRVSGFRMSDQVPSNRATSGSSLANPPRKGFGLTLEEKGENLVVDSLVRNGNAFDADFRRGDLILEIGGAPVKSIAEFDEITGILAEGDQIEVGISRGGKQEKKLLQLGSVPAATTPASETMRGPALAPSFAPDFVPNLSPEPDVRLTRQLPGFENRGGLGDSVMGDARGSQQSIRNNAAILQMQETIRRQQVVIEQLQHELKASQGTSRRRN